MTARELIAQLKGVRKCSGGWSAQCPAHDDKHASLSISESNDGNLLLKCHAGCSFESILAAIPQGQSATSHLVAEYDYHDEKGVLLYQVVRLAQKDFRQRRPDGKGGWEWKLNGTRRVLYRLPELLGATPNRTVAVVEGEKDVESLRTLGIIATTNVGGACKWRDDYCEPLRERNVVVFADNDKAGRKHALMVATSLHSIAASVKVVELPGLPEHGDVSDWLDAGNGIKELRELVEAATIFDPFAHSSDGILKNYTDFMSEPVTDGETIAFEAARGEVVSLQSVTNKGKSTLIRNAAFSLAAGREFLTLVPSAIERRVVLLNFEGARGRFQGDLSAMEKVFDDNEKDRIRRNLFTAHAPELDDEPLSLSRHMKVFEAEARAIKPDVIFIDTVTTAFSIKSESDNSEVIALMKTLIRVARNLNSVIVIVHHIGKARAEEGQNREAVHRSRGASAWGDTCSASFNLESNPATPDIATLTCGKRKTGTGQNYEINLRLDREGRWFSSTSDGPPKALTNREQVLRVLNEFTTLRYGRRGAGVGRKNE